MAKLDDIFEALEQGLEGPNTQLYTVMVADKDFVSTGLRRKKGTSGATHHRIWVLAIGVVGAGGQTTFCGNKPTDCIKKAMEWKGIAPVKGEEESAE